jgi:NAD(P)-dependent dehydrogenase (short-subunit alcohol dehydrogenase family)
MQPLTSQIALVTGASRGVGKGIALAEASATIILFPNKSPISPNQ